MRDDINTKIIFCWKENRNTWQTEKVWEKSPRIVHLLMTADDMSSPFVDTLTNTLCPLRYCSALPVVTEQFLLYDLVQLLCSCVKMHYLLGVTPHQ